MANLDEIKTIIADQLGLDTAEVTEDSRIVEDLGAESQDSVAIIAAIEDRFDVKVPNEDVQNLLTVRDVYTYLQG